MELEKLVEQLRADLSESDFERAAAIITNALTLIERGVEGERQVIRAERELLEQQQHSVEAERRLVHEERKEIESLKAAAEKQLHSAEAGERARDGLNTLTSALKSGSPSAGETA